MLHILTQDPQLNIYQMWFAAQPNALWITRTTWSNLCAHVISIGEVKGPPPYYGNPEVRADVYTAGGYLKQRGTIISVPGTYKTWRQVADPYWAKKMQHNHLDSPLTT